MTLKEKVAEANSMVEANVYLASRGDLSSRKLRNMGEVELRKALLLVRANRLNEEAKTRKRYYI